MANKSFTNFGLGEYDDYTLYNLNREFDLNTLKKEYTRLRSIAKQRYDRLSMSAFKGDEFVRNWAGEFKTLSELGEDKRAIAGALARTATFLRNPQSTISGIKKRYDVTLDTLARHGYSFLNVNNIGDFLEFMDHVRDLIDLRSYDSERFVEMFKNEYDPDNPGALKKVFNEWMNNPDSYEL